VSREMMTRPDTIVSREMMTTDQIPLCLER
jgi:hypothetical protein